MVSTLNAAQEIYYKTKYPDDDLEMCEVCRQFYVLDELKVIHTSHSKFFCCNPCFRDNAMLFETLYFLGEITYD